ncbi:hypothetical protein FRB97_007719 [Tulasnella sp. 331]|nr:hypothetical protein FRB97_007719 [Tulasnella sp. 331]
MHVPVDRRKEVWNTERASEQGGAREEGDKEERRVRDEEAEGIGMQKEEAGSSGSKLKKKGKGKMRSDDEDSDDDLDDISRKGKGKRNGGGGTNGEKSAPLGEVRLRSDKVDKNGDYFVGVMRDGKLHLHRISEIQQFRPTLTYLDVMARQKSKPATLDDEGDGGDEVEPAIPASAPKAREVVVSARGSEASGGGMGQMSALRREMISAARKEQKEGWVDLEWFDEMVDKEVL